MISAGLTGKHALANDPRLEDAGSIFILYEVL